DEIIEARDHNGPGFWDKVVAHYKERKAKSGTYDASMLPLTTRDFVDDPMNWKARESKELEFSARYIIDALDARGHILNALGAFTDTVLGKPLEGIPSPASRSFLDDVDVRDLEGLEKFSARDFGEYEIETRGLEEFDLDLRDFEIDELD
ncbi:hypothetical protein H0H87_009971, partial [Tephrocybe sp. NHM501043]